MEWNFSITSRDDTGGTVGDVEETYTVTLEPTADGSQLTSLHIGIGSMDFVVTHLDSTSLDRLGKMLLAWSQPGVSEYADAVLAEHKQQIVDLFRRQDNDTSGPPG